MSLDEDEGEEAKGGVKSAVDLGPVRAELEAILAELGDPALVARLAG